jgi:SAM-dependent methyltransferase
MGWVSEELGAVSALFVEFSCGERLPVLDVGAAFGAASREALRAGASVVANDLDAGHLEELRRRVNEEERARLRIRVGRFPREVHFEPESLGAVHAANVFHFLTGNQLQEGMRAIARWLRPGGKLFVQAATPYQAPFAAFVPEYEQRLRNGEKWPGWMAKVSAYSTHRQLSQMPRAIHLLDDRILHRVAEGAGLETERVWLFRRRDLPSGLHMDGRETVGLVARKAC